MSKSPENRDVLRVLALLWHAPHLVIAAGGFRRAYEVFARIPDGFDITVLDDHPTFLGGIDRPNLRVAEYVIPGPVRRLEARFFWLERVLEWALSTLTMVFRCAGMRLRGEKFDVIYVPSSEQLPALAAGIAARFLFRARLVACNLNIDIFPERTRKPIARLHNAADTVITISEHLKVTLDGYGTRLPMVVNTVGLDTDQIASVPGCEPGDKEYDAVFVGRHDPEKGVFDLVEIWSKLVRTLPGARLLMIGSCNPGNRARLSAMLSELGIAGAVTMAGVVSDDEKYSLMKRSKICLFPSYVEEWGLVPQEALACGLPAVVYDLPVYRENIAGCGAVFRLPVADASGMAAMAVELLEGDRYLDYAEVGPPCVSGFNWDEVAGREFEILRRQQPGRK